MTDAPLSAELPSTKRHGTAPLLVAQAARIAIDGRPAFGPFDCMVRGSRLVLAGDTGPLLSVLTSVPLGAKTRAIAVEPVAIEPEGVATLASGKLELAGLDVGAREHVASVGAAPLDPPLPLDFTPVEFVRWSAKLAGLGQLSRPRALEALERVGLARAAKRALKTFSLPEKRVLLLAHAAVSSPAVIVAEAPLADLEGEGATFVTTALSRVVEGRASIVSVRRLAPGTTDSMIIERSTHLLYLSRGEVVLSGEPKSILALGRHYGVTVESNAAALKAELAARGIELQGGPRRFSVALPEGKDTTDVLAAAATARAAVVELLALM